MAAHEHAPAVQVAPGSQVVPQLPQLWLSVWVLTQALLQTVELAPVQSAAHACDLIDVGATLVAVGTESFRDPAAAAGIARGLATADAG